MNNKFLFLLIILSFSCNFKNQNLDTDKESNNNISSLQDSIESKEIKNHIDSSWKKAGISWCYKLDEKNSFTEGCDGEKEWLDAKIKNLLSKGLPRVINSNHYIEWNPANELYFFVSVPDIEQEEYLKFVDYENSIEISINNISTPATLYKEIETEYGRLFYYKLPIWFWDLEMITPELSHKKKEKIYGKNYLKNGPPYASDGILYGFTTKVKRIYKLHDIEDENKIVKTEEKTLTNHHFVCAFGE